MNPDRFNTVSLHDARLERVLAAALEAVDPAKLVSNALKRLELPGHDRAYVLGLGKAAEAMTLAAADMIPEFESALIVTKHAIRAGEDTGTQASAVDSRLPNSERIKIMEAGHPLPDEASIAAGHAALDFVSRVAATDLLVCLISGGGSALVTVPARGVSLSELQDLTGALLASGAKIDEMNVLRRELDRVKGGGLAEATRAAIVSLILSDVPGDHLEAIASGPTAPNPTTNREAKEILQKYGIEPPPAIRRALTFEASRSRPVLRGRVANHVIGNNGNAVWAAAKEAEDQGFGTEVLERPLTGEAREVGAQLASRLSSVLAKGPRPRCLIAGGETTVTVKGTGKGGRNQELALGAVSELAGFERVLLVSLATDGEDGPTDAAGAVATGTSLRRGEQLGMNPDEYLKENDAYAYFDAIGDLIRTGPTGTNVNDLVILAGL